MMNIFEYRKKNILIIFSYIIYFILFLKKKIKKKFLQNKQMNTLRTGLSIF